MKDHVPIVIRYPQPEDTNLMLKAVAGSYLEGKIQQVVAAHNVEVHTMLAAYCADRFAGYVTVINPSIYDEFKKRNIPEIADLNVLSEFRRKGIALKLLNEAENLCRKLSPVAGIGVGLTSDYGSAQQFYVKKGFIPFGQGLTYKYKPVAHGKVVQVDDHLVFWMTKSIGEP
jgi:GNAT superfamily N-acetyltransferase